MFMIVNFLLKHSSKRKGGGSPKLPKHIYHSIALDLTKDFLSNSNFLNHFNVNMITLQSNKCTINNYF